MAFQMGAPGAAKQHACIEFQRSSPERDFQRFALLQPIDRSKIDLQQQFTTPEPMLRLDLTGGRRRRRAAKPAAKTEAVDSLRGRNVIQQSDQRRQAPRKRRTSPAPPPRPRSSTDLPIGRRMSGKSGIAGNPVDTVAMQENERGIMRLHRFFQGFGKFHPVFR